jgi:hypothetical protein
VLAVITEIKKRVEMRTVNGLVMIFAPRRFFPRAGPLVYTALNLMTSTTHQRSATRVMGRRFDPYHCECKADSFDWDWFKVIIEDNPVVLLVLEPYDIDNFLDNGVSI